MSELEYDVIGLANLIFLIEHSNNTTIWTWSCLKFKLHSQVFGLESDHIMENPGQFPLDQESYYRLTCESNLGV